jgi:alkylated DNA nucleotide flippase Atl1
MNAQQRKNKTLKSITEIPVSNVTSYNVVREIVGAT